jgi:hypothetical protein
MTDIQVKEIRKRPWGIKVLENKMEWLMEKQFERITCPSPFS